MWKNLSQRWTANMRRDQWTSKPYSTLCSDHFEEKHFDRTGQTTRLRADAVPTLFSFPQHLMKTVKQRKAPFPPNAAQPDVQLQQKEDTPTSTTDDLSPALEDVVCDAPVSAVPSPPPRPVPKGTDGPPLIAPEIPAKQSDHDHSYSIRESPRGVKRKLDKMFDHMSNMKKRLRTTQTRARRLKKRVESLQEVIKTLKEENMLSESGLEMLEKTCNVPAEITRRHVKPKGHDVPSLQGKVATNKSTSISNIKKGHV
uniref:THAP domain-containing protein 1-like isoform X2 n=1 Tax=Doryrhamphus excisus TaxID=161450 RepID=UPI0025AEC74D|nr:THAP domain-containing protein 1-like isoform X2 [Doryrhamphus excisus]